MPVKQSIFHIDTNPIIRIAEPFGYVFEFNIFLQKRASFYPEENIAFSGWGICFG